MRKLRKLPPEISALALEADGEFFKGAVKGKFGVVGGRVVPAVGPPKEMCRLALRVFLHMAGEAIHILKKNFFALKRALLGVAGQTHGTYVVVSRFHVRPSPKEPLLGLGA